MVSQSGLRHCHWLLPILPTDHQVESCTRYVRMLQVTLAVVFPKLITRKPRHSLLWYKIEDKRHKRFTEKSANKSKCTDKWSIGFCSFIQFFQLFWRSKKERKCIQNIWVKNDFTKEDTILFQSETTVTTLLVKNNCITSVNNNSALL